MSMKTNEHLSDIPQEHIDMIRKLAAEGMPAGRIAFLTHMSESVVREVLATSVNTTEEQTPANQEGGSSR
jgi:hypothetical protein